MVYPDPHTEKQRVREAKEEIEKATKVRKDTHERAMMQGSKVTTILHA